MAVTAGAAITTTKRNTKPKAKVKVGPSQKHIDAAERVRASTIGSGEPIINPKDYVTSLMRAMTYYNVYEDSKMKRKWVQKYIGPDAAKLKLLDAVPDYELLQLSSVIRLKEREQPLLEKELKFIETKLDEIFTKSKLKGIKNGSEELESKPVLSIAEKIANIADTHIAELEAELDIFAITKANDFDMKAYIEKNTISPQAAKHIAAWFKKTETELTAAVAGKDEQLVEGYSYFKPAQLKKYLAFVTSIISACTQQKVKVVRARIPKAKPPSEVVKHVKYMTEFAELGLKSEHPTKLINSSEVWLYNTRVRRITVLKALPKDILVVKGGSIVNFDTSKSEVKTLRKPEEFLKVKLDKKSLNAAWATLTTKPAAANGRISEDVIILGVF